MTSKKKRQEAARDILVKGLEKLQKKWTKNALAKDLDGDEIDIGGLDAVHSVCAIGALSYAQGNITDDIYEMSEAMKDAVCVLYEALPKKARLEAGDVTDLGGKVGVIESWNDSDSRRKREVVNAFKRAIELCDE